MQLPSHPPHLMPPHASMGVVREGWGLDLEIWLRLAKLAGVPAGNQYFGDSSGHKSEHFKDS
jgi:hypothetical protein